MNKNELQKMYREIVLKTNGGIDDYVVALCQIGNAIGELDDQQQQVADLQYRLSVAEKALELACETMRYELGRDAIKNLYNDAIKNLKDNLNMKTDKEICQWYLEQAEKALKGE